MPDKYANFAQLFASEAEGSYAIEFRPMNSALALIAPHAGKIEPGTSEICRAVAGNDLTYYLFQGLKPNNNRDLHITSSRFDEPNGLAAASSAEIVTTFHGQTGTERFVNVGGLASDLVETMIDRLSSAGYAAERHSDQSLQGLSQNNICNRGRSHQGLQLEISRGLRDKVINDRDELVRFSDVIRAALQGHGF